jgi:hypothetical protein
MLGKTKWKMDTGIKINGIYRYIPICGLGGTVGVLWDLGH